MIGKIMAIDYGSKRIGIAFSDPLRLFAKAHSVIPNNGIDEVVVKITSLIKDNQANLVVVGIPYAIDGTNTPKTLETLEFIDILQNRIPITITGMDERYSSQEAEEILKNRGESWQKARQKVDAVAAAMILTNYLEQHS